VQAILTEGRGKANVDTRNNQVIITDTAEKIQQAKQIVQKIDTVTPQVIIEARVVEANTAFTREVGFDWGQAGIIGGVQLGTFDVPKTSSWDVGPTSFVSSNIPAGADPAGALVFNLMKTSGTSFQIVESVLVAAEVEDKINIVSAPRVVTLDNKKAKIMQGFEIPYLERDETGTSSTIQFKNVDLLLEVTPTVSPDNRIRMVIFVTKNDLVDPDITPPALSTNEANTEILVDDGDTIVIGGILKSTLSWREDGLPGLRNLAVLGWLFKYQREVDEKKELLIFLTPQIVRLEQKRLS
jgi:type IV pilus assembly protein PilQ